MANDCKVIYLDEQLPPVNETVLLVIAELDYDETPADRFQIYYDFGGMYEDGTLWTTNDWDEGQPWAIVGWLKEPKLPTEEELRKHNINWKNVKDMENEDAIAAATHLDIVLNNEAKVDFS